MQPWDVVVVGSANVDVVLDVRQLPRPGATVLGRRREEGPGGKGANQAIAAARSGARTALVAAVGADSGGRLLEGALSAAGVSLTALRTSDLPTGTAYVTVDAVGENAIVVDPGANASLTDLVAEELDLVRRSRVLLCQLEIPIPAIAAAVGHAGGLTVLNAAPVPERMADLPDVDVLVVNEHEARAAASASTVAAAVDALLQRAAEVVVTLGADGALLATRDGRRTRVDGVPAREVVDTTGAGDTFCGAYAAARAAGSEPAAAVALACAAASLSVERPGAGGSAPSLAQAQARLREQVVRPRQ
jgi:ribokinase